MRNDLSVEYDDCGIHILECICGSGCPCRQRDVYTHLNVVKKCMQKDSKSISLDHVVDSSAENIPVKWINVRGRAEHEAIIKDESWCKELGLDQVYEIRVYLNRWGEWLIE